MTQLTGNYLKQASVGALLLLLGLLLTPVALTAAPADRQNSSDLIETESSATASALASKYQQSVEQLEITGGAYSAELGERLSSLGYAYFTENNLPKAISALKRSAFISRVNNGLNNPMQIPIVENLIEAYIAAGQYHEADERQSYLYRIQTINYQHDQQRSLRALIDFAEWQRQAYLLNLDKRPGMRLLMMHDAYQLAIQTIIGSGDIESEDIVAPLEGLMSAQYLLSVYQGHDPEAFQINVQTSSGEFGSPLDNQMEFLRSNAFKQGNGILDRLHSIHTNAEQTSALTPVEHRIASADWHLWYNKRSTAMNLYRDAYNKLLKLEDAEMHIERLFGSPLRLPTIKSTQSELLALKRHKKDDSGRFLVSYNVSKSGKPFQIELIQAEPEGKSRRRSKLLRELKSKRFRPKFENGEPVVTENIVEEYVY